MKKKTTAVLCLMLLAVAANLFAGEKHDLPPYTGSAEFEKIKGLAGEWRGTHEMEGKPADTVVTYRVTSNNSAVVETIAPGTPHEMVSVYHDRGGRLSMTHYCAVGNQPELDLVSSDEGKLTFEISDRSDVEIATEMHMHGLTLEFPADGSLVQKWVSYADGKQSDVSEFKLTRTGAVTA